MRDILGDFPPLCCVSCHKTGLVQNGDDIMCPGCDERYLTVDGKYPRMLAKDGDFSSAEVEVQDRVASHYENSRYANVWSGKYHTWWTDLMIDQVDTSGRILDNGCGIGELHERLPSANITGLDISAEMVRIAGTKYERAVIGDSQTLPFEDGYFDTIFARSLIHHLPDPARGVREMARVMRPGGELVAIDTNASLLSVVPRMIANRGEHFSEEHKNLDEATMRALFAPWFEVETVRFFGYLAYPILGFPDLMDLFRFFPAKSLSYDLLMRFDEALSSIPIVKRQAWGLLVKGRKRGQD